MTSPNNLEINGNLSEHPLAELLVEIQQIRLNGSLRLVNDGQKVVVYFDAGDVVFAISNSRQHRLYELLLRENKISKQQLLAISDFTDDLALSGNLLKNNLLEQMDVDVLFSRQIVEILCSGFDWQAGSWIFSPHIRIKGDIRFKIDLPRLLIEYARKLSPAIVIRRFKSLRELFGVKSAMPVQVNLLPPEAFVFSRFENSFLSVEKNSVLSGMADDEALKILYTLWLGGFIFRQDWNVAFNERKTAAILSANFTLKTDENTPITKAQEIKPVNMQTVETKFARKTEPIEEKLSLEDYLYRIENATNHYETLDISLNAPVAKIKQGLLYSGKTISSRPFLQRNQCETVSANTTRFYRICTGLRNSKN